MLVSVFLCPECRRRFTSGAVPAAEIEVAVQTRTGSPDCRLCAGPIGGAVLEGQLSLL